MPMNLPRRAFTVVELLVVVTIIALLVALLLSGIQLVRASARRAQCQNNLRQLHLAATNYHDAINHYPPGFEQHFFDTAPAYRGQPLFAELLPFLEETSLSDGWDKRDLLTNAVGENARTGAIIPVLVCPDDYIPQNPVQRGDWFQGISSYGGNGGTRVMNPEDATTDGVFHTTGPASEPIPAQQPVRIRQITDGTAHTLLFGERYHYDAHLEAAAAEGLTESLASWGWWGPVAGRRAIGHVTLSSESGVNFKAPLNIRDRTIASPLQNDIRLRKTGYGSGHSSGAYFALCGGHVQFLDDGIEPQILHELGTRAGSH